MGPESPVFLCWMLASVVNIHHESCDCPDAKPAMEMAAPWLTVIDMSMDHGHSLADSEHHDYPLVNVYKKLLKMAIEIVDLPIKNSDFP